MRQRKKRPPSAPGDLSSTSELLRGMQLPGGKFPGDRVIKETRKGVGNQRYFVFYGGRVKKTTKRDLARLARNRGYDVAVRKFEAGDPQTRSRMLRNSLRWQAGAKTRWLNRFEKKLATVRNPQKRKRLEAQRTKLDKAQVRSPLVGGRPISSYVRRYWD